MSDDRHVVSLYASPGELRAGNVVIALCTDRCHKSGEIGVVAREEPRNEAGRSLYTVIFERGGIVELDGLKPDRYELAGQGRCVVSVQRHGVSGDVDLRAEFAAGRLTEWFEEAAVIIGGRR